VFDSKVIRRRRAALAIFVVLSIGMLTVYFGESGGGIFHTLQRGAQAAFAPLETGASRALKPVRDLFGWVGDTFDAKSENEDLRAEVEQLRRQLGVAETARHDVRELRALVGLNESEGYPQGTEPVGARVILRSPTVWYSTIKIDKGSNDGVRRDQPVVAAGGLVGKVSEVTGGTAQVTLITDASSAVSAQVMPNGATGIVHPVVGNPDDLLLDYISKGRRVTEGTTVVTSGFESDGVESLFPRGIAIGRVTKVDPEETEQFQRVHVKPLADIRGIDYVQVLTERGVSTQAGVPLQ
jgi:rod shape-determining protein MreC